MGEIVSFVREKLICGILVSRETEFSRVLSLMENHWGPVDYRSPEYKFVYTDYYEPEMGVGIRRIYLSFQETVPPEMLAGIKILSNSLEDNFRKDQRRTVNLDPGLLSLGRVILASSKDAGHRIPLSGGIYGEVTLVFRFGEWHTLDWTYPDYGSSECREHMLQIRQIYRRQRRTDSGISAGSESE